MTEQFDYEALGLPWKEIQGYTVAFAQRKDGVSYIRVDGSDNMREITTAYIVHAANLYPKLVELAKQIVLEDEENPMSIPPDIASTARAVLAETGRTGE